MEIVSVDLKNCYGIKKLKRKFDFGDSKINIIYAKNGLMKTSFAKVFKKYQEGKESEIKEIIFNNSPTSDILIDNRRIKAEEIFVINSFENSYESDSIASLLINKDVKESLEEVLLLKEKLYNSLVKKSGLSITRIFKGKRVYELEPTLINDFSFLEQSFLLSMSCIQYAKIDYNFENIKYQNIFDKSVQKKIKSEKFQSAIHDYIQKSDEIYENYGFLDKGKFTLGKLKDIEKRLASNNFFVKQNKIVLGNQIELLNNKMLNDKIKEIENDLQATTEFRQIENLLSDSKGIILKDIIENNPEIIDELRIDNLDEFRKKLWLSYIKADKELFEILFNKFIELKEKVSNSVFTDTPWKKAVDIFNDRFCVPFKMEINNPVSAIIGESVPSVVFSFCRDGNVENLDPSNWVKLNREQLETGNTLNQGERRALYLINIIFDIERRKAEGKETLFIIDDIADSFDYKNKYAIVEYLNDISSIDKFYLIILSHNFDFYRTIASRLTHDRKHRFHATNSFDEVILEEEFYQNKPFVAWKNSINKKSIIALIPFIRNIVEYSRDRNINPYQDIDRDYIFLTNLLHIKNSTKELTISDLNIVYKEYLKVTIPTNIINHNCKVYDLILDIANNEINEGDVELENKIVLAITIRLIVEEFLIKKIGSSSANFCWMMNGQRQQGNKDDFLDFVSSKANQTRELINGYCKINQSNKDIFERVSIMTPENIHLNSFMYEPLIDMDITELLHLYRKVKEL